MRVAVKECDVVYTYFEFVCVSRELFYANQIISIINCQFRDCIANLVDVKNNAENSVM